jgi:hypothetical protein
MKESEIGSEIKAEYSKIFKAEGGGRVSGTVKLICYGGRIFWKLV